MTWSIFETSHQLVRQQAAITVLALARMATGKGKRCCVVGCREPHKSLHIVPSDNRRTPWLNFIFDGNVPSTVGKHLVVCANHFSADCFGNFGQYQAGLASRLRLTEGCSNSPWRVDRWRSCKYFQTCLSFYCNGVSNARMLCSITLSLRVNGKIRLDFSCCYSAQNLSAHGVCLSG